VIKERAKFYEGYSEQYIAEKDKYERKNSPFVNCLFAIKASPLPPVSVFLDFSAC
jgi:hypothetical protein